MKTLAILGAGGHAKVVADAALRSGRTIEFFDDAWPRSSAVGPWPVTGDTDGLLREPGRVEAVVAIGDNRVRLMKLRALAAAGVPIVSVLHPLCAIGSHVSIGNGTVMFAGAVLNPFAGLGEGCILNTSSSVDHDCVIADGVHIAPGAHIGGGVHVGEGSLIGIGATVKPGVTIGARVVVGAGAVVLSDVPDDDIVAGVPARTLTAQARR